MLKKVLIVIINFLLVCAYAEKSQPEWVKNYREKFPDEKYVAQIGYSKSKDSVKIEALNSLVQYLEVNVDSTISSTHKSLQENINGEKKISSVHENTKDIQVSVDLTVQAIEYTEPYYKKKEKTWGCVAYFERTKAFNIYKPQVESIKLKIESLFDLLKSKDDLFQQIRIFNEIKNNEEEFFNKYNFAFLLSPNEARETYGYMLERVEELISLIIKKIVESPIFIKVNNEKSKIIHASVSSVFTDMGWVVATNKNEAVYDVYCDVSYEEYSEQQNTNILYSIYPHVNIKIKKGGDILYSYEKNDIGKVSGYNHEKTIAKTEVKIAGIIRNYFSLEFNAFIGNK